ncbi:MAG TPA: DoxX family protein [Burkholderiaceae bacterium]|nr:DoxX family protein [Burkholderiaceae bacterium]
MSTQTSNNGVALIGRILLALIFILSGFGKIAGFAGTAGYIASKGLPMASVLAALTIVVELGGGLALLTGFHARWAALALAVFSVLAALIFHNFWAVPAEQAMNQNIHFMKNIAIAGGMLMVFAFGPGSLSLGGKRAD